MFDYKEFGHMLLGRWAWDGGYESSGYVLLWRTDNPMPDGSDRFEVYSFAHCSCYGTSEGVSDVPAFSGTWWDLQKIAQGESDLDFPLRKIDPSDYNYKYVAAMYDSIRNRPFPSARRLLWEKEVA